MENGFNHLNVCNKIHDKIRVEEIEEYPEVTVSTN